MQLTAFPFYSNINQQLRFHPRLSGAMDWQLLSPPYAFLPFRIKKPANRIIPACIEIFTEAGVHVQDVTPNLRLFTDNTWDYVYYFGQTIAGLDLACGKYYLTAGGFTSEVFTVTTDTGRMLKVTWSNNTKISVGTELLAYPQNWQQWIFLDTDLHEPEYNPTLEPIKNGNGTDLISYGKISKQHKFDTELLPEFLHDALSLLPLHATVSVGPYQHVQSLSVRPKSYTQGVLAQAEVEFIEAEIIRTSCTVMELEEITGTILPGDCGQAGSAEPVWVRTGEYSCFKSNLINNGLVRYTEKDLNPASTTYNQTRTVLGSEPNFTLCPVPLPTVYKSAAIAEFVSRNNCLEDETGGTVMYKLEQGAFTSAVSQSDANSLAEAHFHATKQAYANTNAECTVINTARPVYDLYGCFTGLIKISDIETRQATSEEIDQFYNLYGNDGRVCPVPRENPE